MFRKIAYKNLLIFIILIVTLSAPTTSKAQISSPYYEGMDINSQSGNTRSYITRLKFAAYETFWADGKADLIREFTIINLGELCWDSYTWGVHLGPDIYSNIRAWDDFKPLDVTVIEVDNGVDLTINFDKCISVGDVYHFSLAFSVEGIASGSGDNWGVGWSITPGSVQEFKHAITIPNNAQFDSITPEPTYQYLNYVEWTQTDFPEDTSFSFYINYTLSNIMDVQLFLQTDKPWEDDEYGRIGSGIYVRNYGCTMTSSAMIVNYWGQRSNPIFETDPEKLNDWLRKWDGYNINNGVDFIKVAEYAQKNGVNLTQDHSLRGENDILLDQYLRSGNPVILGVKPFWNTKDSRWDAGHWVVATGKTTYEGHETYAINDPSYGETTLYERWNNYYLRLVTFTGTPADLTSLQVSAFSPVELIITDPLGRRSGYDPTTDTVFEEIPGTAYYTDTIVPEDTTFDPLPPSLNLHIETPMKGIYNLEIIGTGEGEYVIETTASNWLGEVTKITFDGNAHTGSSDIFDIDFTPENGIFNNFIFLPTILR